MRLLAMLLLCASFNAGAYIHTASNNDYALVDGTPLPIDDWINVDPNAITCNPNLNTPCKTQHSVYFPNGRAVSYVEVTVRFSHGEYDSEVFLNLQHNGEHVTLIPFGGLFSQTVGYFEVTYSDLAEGIMPDCWGVAGEPEFCQTGVGTFLPMKSAMSAFNGLDAKGKWTLTIADGDSSDPTALYGFDLTVHSIPEPTPALLLGAVWLCCLYARRCPSRMTDR